MPEMPFTARVQETRADVMTPEQLDKAFDNTIRDLKGQYFAKTMLAIGGEATRMIKARVQETGVDAKGKKYPPYSTKDILVGCKTFIQKSACQELLGSKPKRRELEWRTVDGHRLAILKGGYKKIRELQNRQTNHVDFSVTNDMWNDINVISPNSEHQRGIVIIGAKQQLQKDKLAGNTKRKGDILDLSKKEQDELMRIYGLNMLQVFKENGL